MSYQGKRLILCLDGTWVNSDKGYNRPTLQQPNATLQVPSNVTRLYRSLKKRDLDGKSQIVYYQPGVGTEGNITDTIAGGVFGAGVSEVGEFTSMMWKVTTLTTCDRTLERLTVSSQRIMSLVMKLSWWGFLAVLSLRVVWR